MGGELLKCWYRGKESEATTAKASAHIPANIVTYISTDTPAHWTAFVITYSKSYRTSHNQAYTVSHITSDSAADGTASRSTQAARTANISFNNATS